MGQYYKPCILQDDKQTIKAWVYSHDFGSGLKLMEHSWFKNEFVGSVEKQLTPHGSWYKSRIVWAGDYADTIGAEDTTTGNTYDLCSDDFKFQPPAGVIDKSYKYIINHSKKEFVNKTKVKSVDGWKIHPLPLLTSEGNGRGGGDFGGDDPNKLIGSWARDVISVETVKPIGYKEIIFDLTEG